MDRMHDAAYYARNAATINTLIQGLFSKSSDEAMAGRKGAYFCVTHRGVSVGGGLVGEVAIHEKREKYDRLSREKCVRTFENRKVGHTLSRQSMDESTQKYAGGAAGNENEYGFSGYAADVDEVASVMLALFSGDLTHEQACELLHDNAYFHVFDEYEYFDRKMVG